MEDEVKLEIHPFLYHSSSQNIAEKPCYKLFLLRQPPSPFHVLMKVIVASQYRLMYPTYVKHSLIIWTFDWDELHSLYIYFIYTCNSICCICWMFHLLVPVTLSCECCGTCVYYCKCRGTWPTFSPLWSLSGWLPDVRIKHACSDAWHDDRNSKGISPSIH